MIGFIIWIIGLILAIKAVLEIMKWKVDGQKNVTVTIDGGKYTTNSNVITVD